MHHISKIIRILLSIHLEIFLRNLLVLIIGSHDKIPSVFCAYCKRQGHVISDYPVLKARKESKPEVAYSSSESSFKQDFMPSRVSHCPQTGNILNQLPPSKDFTCSSMTSRDYVPLGGHLTTVHLDLMFIRLLQMFIRILFLFTKILLLLIRILSLFIKILRFFIRISYLLLRIYPLSKAFVLHETSF